MLSLHCKLMGFSCSPAPTGRSSGLTVNGFRMYLKLSVLNVFYPQIEILGKCSKFDQEINDIALRLLKRAIEMIHEF